MKTNSKKSNRKLKNRKNTEENLPIYESSLRALSFIASLILAGFAIYQNIDSPVIWTFLGYAIGSSGAGIKSI